MGAIILGGCVLDDFHNEMFGNAREYLELGGVIGLLKGAIHSQERLLRNFSAGISAMYGFPFVRGAYEHAPLWVNIINGTTSAFFVMGSIVANKKMKKSKTLEKTLI